MTSSERAYPTVDIIEFFKTRSVLVVAAVTALDAIPAALTQLKALLRTSDLSRLSDHLQALETLARDAAIGDDNLLIADPASVQKPFVVCAVNRQPSGAVDVRTIELDRDALALGDAEGGAARPLNALAEAVHLVLSDRSDATIRDTEAAVDALAAQVRMSMSRLSIVKARLDLQQSFLASVLEPETAPLVRLDSHLDQAGVRDMALAAGRLLSGGSLNIANGNRKMLTSLFEKHAATVA